MKTAPELTVVDLGTGTVFFAALFFRALPDGKVIAFEPAPALVKWLKKRKAH